MLISSRTHMFSASMTTTLFALSAVMLLSACTLLPHSKSEPTKTAQEEPKEAPPPKPPEPKPAALYQWYGDGRTVSRIEIDVDAQKAVFYSGSHEIGWTRVASGVRSYPTPTGQFAVTEKVVEKRSNIYGKIYNRKGKLVRSNAELGVHPIPPGGRFEGAKMPYFLRLTNDGIGLHAGPIPKPGRPASHGCIRLPHALAPVLFDYVSIGTPVDIIGSGPSYERYLAAQQRKARSRRAPRPAAESAVAAIDPATSTAPSQTPANALSPTVAEQAPTTGHQTSNQVASSATSSDTADIPAQSDASTVVTSSVVGKPSAQDPAASQEVSTAPYSMTDALTGSAPTPAQESLTSGATIAPGEAENPAIPNSATPLEPSQAKSAGPTQAVTPTPPVPPASSATTGAPPAATTEAETSQPPRAGANEERDES